MSAAETCVVSFAGDTHSHAVCWGLRKLGIDARFLDVHKFFLNHRLSIRQSRSGLPEIVLDAVPVSTTAAIWLRRPYAQEFGLSNTIHPDDLFFSRVASKGLVSELMTAFGMFEFCVDPIHVSERIDKRVFQLFLAQQCGFHIAETLLTNDSDVAMEFVQRTEVLLKAIQPFAWESSTGDVQTTVCRISPEQLKAASATVRACPIYLQDLLVSDDEIRVTCIGKNIFAASLKWHNKGGASPNWKVDPKNIVPTHIDLPEAVKSKLIKFMKIAGMRFGAFDLIRRGEEYFFVEVNVGGQWLWMNRERDGLPLLDCFVKFLALRDDNFRYDGKVDILCEEFWDSVGKETYDRLRAVDEDGSSEVLRINRSYYGSMSARESS